MTDTPVLDDPKVEPLFPNRPSAAPLGPQPDLLALAERFSADVAEGKCIGAILILYSQDGSAYSNSAGAVTIANGIAQLELFKAQLLLNTLLPARSPL